MYASQTAPMGLHRCSSSSERGRGPLLVIKGIALGWWHAQNPYCLLLIVNELHIDHNNHWTSSRHSFQLFPFIFFLVTRPHSQVKTSSYWPLLTMSVSYRVCVVWVCVWCVSTCTTPWINRNKSNKYRGEKKSSIPFQTIHSCTVY